MAPDQAAAVRLSGEAARAIFRHDWPLNVRELEACLGIATALAGTEMVKLEHLPGAVRGERRVAPAEPSPALTEEDARRRDELMELLRQHRGNISAVARAAGKARVPIHRWLKRYRLDPRSFRR